MLQNRAKLMTNKQHLYRAHLHDRQTEMFRSAVDELGKPSNNAAFMRMVKGARKRQAGGGCALDPEKVDEYVEHFWGTFGGEPKGQPLEANAPQAEVQAEMALADLINVRTITQTLQKLPRGKAWGADDVPAELLTCGQVHLVGPLVAYLTLVATGECIPSVWREALVVPVWKKKGSPTDIAMHRPISLTCTGRRLYERVLLKDINRFVDQLSDLQGGFRPHRGTAHQALTLHEALVCNPNAKVALLDLRAAYDLVDRQCLWEILRAQYGFPQHSVARLQDLFDHCHSRLQFGGVQSKEIDNTCGLMQGSSLSPTIFNFFIDELAHELEARPEGVLVHGRHTPALLFADDTAIIGATEEQLAALLTVCEKWSHRAGMEFSPAKCVCFAPQPHQRNVPLQIYGVDLPSTEKAPYLGYPFTRLGVDFAALCKERCEKAKGVIAML
jgi:Reverse transcriptase (RNA-dependent DNA polymerase)